MAFVLSDYAEQAGYRVVRDGRFSRTGKLSTPLDGLCVPIRSRRWLADLAAHPSVAAVIATPDLADDIDGDLALAVSDRPQDAHSTLHALCAREAVQALRRTATETHPTASIHPSAVVSPHGVQIGPGVIVEAYAQVHASAIVEEGCTIRAGAIVGSDGFAGGVMAGRYGILPQVGFTRLRPGVHVMPGAVVSRAVFGGETLIGEETIIDSRAYVAHDCVIGRRVVICAMANLMGRVTVGDHAHIGPSAVIRNGLQIGERACVSLGAVVTRDVEPGQKVTGNFAVPHEAFIRRQRTLRSPG